MTNAPFILAVPFVTPGFALAGAALISLPIIIHILNRRRYKIVPWAAMEYLLAAMKKNRRRLKFEQWLLLATRCAVLLLLGLALARPLSCAGESSIAALAAERTGLHVFVVDNSYSMAYEAGRPDTRTHLDQAKKIIKTMLARLSRGGESVAIITASSPATSIFAHPTFDIDAALSAVDRIEQSNTATDLAGAFQKAIELANEESRQPTRKLYILSDSTRSAFDTAQANAIKQLGHDAAGQYQTSYFNLGRRDQWNQAALEVRPISHLVTSKFSNDFEAIVKGFGPGPNAMLQWKLDDKPLAGGGSVKLDVDTPPQLQSSAQLKTGGPRVLTASIAGEDHLRIDNTRHRVVDVASELKILIVEGDRGVGLLAGSAAYLDVALAPPKEAGGAPGATPGPAKSDSPFAPEVISDLELGNKVLGDYRAVVLTNVGQIQPPQAEALEKFVRSGGALLLFMGELINSDNYNKVLLPHGLTPGPLTRRMSVGSDQRGYLFDFKPEGDLHPLLQIFRHEQKSGLDTAQAFTYWQVDLPPASRESKIERVLDYLPTGTGAAQTRDAAITAHSLGAGRVVFVSTSAGDWSSLPAKPNFVTLVQELLSGSLTSDDTWMNRLIGQPIEVPASVKLTATPRLTDANKREIPFAQATAAGGQAIYRTRPISNPGVYTLETGGRTYPIAVNLPAEEADVRTLDPAAIKTALGDINLALEGDQAPVEIAKSETGRDFGWSFMLIVLGLVGAECFMAMSFGHYRRTPKP